MPNNDGARGPHQAHARDPRARAAVDRALPPRGLRAQPRLARQREADRASPSRPSSTTTSKPELRAAPATAWNQPVRWPRLPRARCSSSPLPCRRCGPTTGSASRWLRLSPAPHRLRLPHRARRAAAAVRAVLRRDRARRHRAQGGRREGAARGRSRSGRRTTATTSRCSSTVSSRARTRAATPTRCSSSTSAACSPSTSAAATPTTRRSRAACAKGAGPSLASPCRCSCSGCSLGIGLALFVAFFRETYIDRAGAGAVRARDERRRPALHHRRAVPGRASCCKLVPDLGLRSRPDRDRRASSRCRC